MTRTRIHNLSISLDGFATGEGQSADAPMGHAGLRLAAGMFPTRVGAPGAGGAGGQAGLRLAGWMFATRFGAPIVGGAGGSAGTDDALAQQHEPGIGAEIMGAGKFGPRGGKD